MESPNWYKILDIDCKCTYDELKAAYRRKLLEYHPDKAIVGKEAADSISNDHTMYHLITQAWTILSNSTTREEYDLSHSYKHVIDSASSSNSSYNAGDVGDIVALAAFSNTTITSSTCSYTYGCRCGGNYEVTSEDFEDEQQYLAIPCDNCSLFITVDIPSRGT